MLIHEWIPNVPSILYLNWDPFVDSKFPDDPVLDCSVPSTLDFSVDPLLDASVPSTSEFSVDPFVDCAVSAILDLSFDPFSISVPLQSGITVLNRCWIVLAFPFLDFSFLRLPNVCLCPGSALARRSGTSPDDPYDTDNRQ